MEKRLQQKVFEILDHCAPFACKAALKHSKTVQ